MPTSPSENEDKYFAEQEAKRRREVRDEMERRAAELAEKERLARAAGLTDVTLADRLRALGITSETAPLLDLLPVAMVAWADGSVSRAERAEVMKLVEARGYSAGSAPWLFMASLLDTRPSGTLLEELRLVLRDFLKGDVAKGEEIVALSRRVAEASGAFFGLGPRVDSKEQELLDRLAAFFAEDAQRQVADDLK
ncbi:MAG: hypothetical protein MUF27_13860 [Acidobacteria bacterium]|jgi:hypothetical protein|nr:hypothetical protein [Acidobacteriota bacterium]